MVWHVSSFTALDVLTSSEMNVLADNFAAMTEADSGAPPVYGDAWPTSYSAYGSQSGNGMSYTPSSGFYFKTGIGRVEIFIGGAWRGETGITGFGGSATVLTNGSKIRFTAGTINTTHHWRRLT